MGDEPLDHPLVYANTHVYALDFSATYAVTDRFDITLDGPLQYGTRQTWIEHNPASMKLHTMEAFGPGNTRIIPEVYFFEPRKTPDRNISLGFGVEFPVGVDNAKDYSYRANNKVLRPVDPAIQPSDGGWGIIGSIHAFTHKSSFSVRPIGAGVCRER